MGVWANREGSGLWVCGPVGEDLACGYVGQLGRIWSVGAWAGQGGSGLWGAWASLGGSGLVGCVHGPAREDLACGVRAWAGQGGSGL